MKRVTILLTMLLVSSLTFLAFGETGKNNEEPAPSISTLVINANVTVVLVNNHSLRPVITGDTEMARLITIKQSGDTLIVNASKGKNLKESGVVYIPATMLKQIRVNSEAHVLSLYTLKLPKIDVFINGACKIEIANVGSVNLVESENYEFEKTAEVRQLPVSVLKNMKLDF